MDEFALKWINEKIAEGKTVVFMPENNGAVIGVWLGVPGETEPALGYGSNVVEAVAHAASWEEIDKIFPSAK